MTLAADVSALRDAVVLTFKAALPAVDVAPHDGAFAEKDIQIFGAKAPALRIAVLGWSAEWRNAVGSVLPVEFSAVLVTADAKQPDGSALPRDVSQLLIGTQIGLVLASARFGVSNTYQPKAVKAQNRYEPSVFAKGLSLFETTWTTELVLGFATPETLGALTQLYVNATRILDPGEVPGADPPLVNP